MLHVGRTLQLRCGCLDSFGESAFVSGERAIDRSCPASSALTIFGNRFPVPEVESLLALVLEGIDEGFLSPPEQTRCICAGGFRLRRAAGRKRSAGDDRALAACHDVDESCAAQWHTGIGATRSCAKANRRLLPLTLPSLPRRALPLPACAGRGAVRLTPCTPLCPHPSLPRERQGCPGRCRRDLCWNLFGAVSD